MPIHGSNGCEVKVCLEFGPLGSSKEIARYAILWKPLSFAADQDSSFGFLAINDDIGVVD